jgi:hypothetical protein
MFSVNELVLVSIVTRAKIEVIAFGRPQDLVVVVSEGRERPRR